MERLPLADRGPAADPGADARGARPLRARAARDRVPEAERAAFAATSCARSKRRGPLLSRDLEDRAEGERESAPLVRQPAGWDHARAPPPARRGRDCRQAQRAAALGSRGALVPGDRARAAGEGRAAARGAPPRARRPPRAGPLARPPGRLRRAGPGPRRLPLPVRPAGLRPRPRRGALGLPLPAGDVRPEGEARVRLLRPAAARRRPDRRPRRARVRRKARTLARHGVWGATRRRPSTSRCADLAAWLGATIEG